MQSPYPSPGALRLRVIDLVYAAHHLKSIRLKLESLPNKEHLTSQSDLRTRPTFLHLELPSISYVERPHPEFDHFLSTLAEQVTDLELCACGPPYSSSTHWSPVEVWPIATRHVETLRELKLELADGTHDVASWQAADFPALEKLELAGWRSYSRLKQSTPGFAHLD